MSDYSRRIVNGPRIVEVKRHPDGAEGRFDSELVELTPSRVVICFRLDRRWLDGPGSSPGQLHSYGVFWRRRPYNCYHIVHPDTGEELVSRFDVLRDVHFDADEVHFTDLYLDLRVDRWHERRVASWEDDDEVEEAFRSGLLTAADLEGIPRARAVLDRGHRRVTAEVRRLLTRLGRLPASVPEAD
jgi:hypothetical protein